MKAKFYVMMAMVLVLALTACGQAVAQPLPAAGETTISALGGGVIEQSTGQPVQGLVASGTGRASAEPEVAQVTFGVELRGEDPSAIVNQGASKVDAAIAAVEDLGVTEEDVKTTSYNLWVETVYNPETGAPTGEVIYHLSHYVQVTLRDLDQVGDLLAAVVEAGANAVSGVNFSVEDPSVLLEQARQQALEEAMSRAQRMADILDVDLGRPILVRETGGGDFPASQDWGMGGGGRVMVEAGAPSVSPGAFFVSVSVQVVYEIQ